MYVVGLDKLLKKYLQEENKIKWIKFLSQVKWRNLHIVREV